MNAAMKRVQTLLTQVGRQGYFTEGPYTLEVVLVGAWKDPNQSDLWCFEFRETRRYRSTRTRSFVVSTSSTYSMSMWKFHPDAARVRLQTPVQLPAIA